MINRLEFLKQGQDNHITQQADADKLETIVCLESVMESCYQTLAGLVYSQAIRKECRRFVRQAQYHQEELKKIFPLSPESETAIKSKVYKCLMQLEPPYLFLRSVINLAISITAYKIDIYQYFSRTNQEHQELLNDFVEDSIEEMDFLRQESKLQKNNLEDASLKVLLEKVIYYLHCV